MHHVNDGSRDRPGFAAGYAPDSGEVGLSVGQRDQAGGPLAQMVVTLPQTDTVPRYPLVAQQCGDRESAGAVWVETLRWHRRRLRRRRCYHNVPPSRRSLAMRCMRSRQTTVSLGSAICSGLQSSRRRSSSCSHVASPCVGGCCPRAGDERSTVAPSANRSRLCGRALRCSSRLMMLTARPTSRAFCLSGKLPSSATESDREWNDVNVEEAVAACSSRVRE